MNTPKAIFFGLAIFARDMKKKSQDLLAQKDVPVPKLNENNVISTIEIWGENNLMI